jgi:hypothetical protein
MTTSIVEMAMTATLAANANARMNGNGGREMRLSRTAADILRISAASPTAGDAVAGLRAFLEACRGKKLSRESDSYHSTIPGSIAWFGLPLNSPETSLSEANFGNHQPSPAARAPTLYVKPA